MAKGFTLAELLVVIALFSIIVGAISGIFFSGLSVQNKILVTQEIVDQTSYVLEYMGRALRMAKKDDLSFEGQTKNCLLGNKVNYETIGNSEIKFRNYQNQCQKFYLYQNRIFEEKEGISLPLTSPTIKINSLKFNLIGGGQDDNLQPRVTIFLEVEGGRKHPSKMKIQTTISQRDLDVQY
jgi:prepilin-type N-terminal cleavage/methylation domain-containing protein